MSGVKGIIGMHRFNFWLVVVLLWCENTIIQTKYRGWQKDHPPFGTKQPLWSFCHCGEWQKDHFNVTKGPCGPNVTIKMWQTDQMTGDKRTFLRLAIIIIIVITNYIPLLDLLMNRVVIKWLVLFQTGPCCGLFIFLPVWSLSMQKDLWAAISRRRRRRRTSLDIKHIKAVFLQRCKVVG